MRRGVALALIVLASAPARAAGPHRDGPSYCATHGWNGADAVWSHEERNQREGRFRVLATRTAAADVGDVAVLQDEGGDLYLQQNIFDMQGTGVQFAEAGGGYSATRLDLPLGGSAGTAVPLGDDATQRVDLPFAFRFYGKSYTQVFVNSDGNLTFAVGDSASDARSLGRMLGGPPRIAPLFTDLDPSLPGASVVTRSEPGRFTVAWVQVPLYGQTQKNSFEVSLHADGRIEFAYDRDVTAGIEEGAMGIAPGRDEGGFTAVDFKTAAGASGSGALAESFRGEATLDSVAVARKFYRTHGDDYQQLVVFTSRRTIPRTEGTFAFELTTKNTDEGLGTSTYDNNASWGSAGKLESFVMMDSAFKYRTEAETKILGEDTSLGVLAHEVGHRWLAQARFSDAGRVSTELLGRQNAHWSFFLDSDGSHVEGNDIEDQGGGNFKTVAAGIRYSPLDQYLMGLRAAEEVPPFFLVRDPQGGAVDAARDPEVGVSFRGTRKDVTIQDVIAGSGARRPAPGPRAPFRQAFVLVNIGDSDTAEAIRVVDTLRSQFEGHFQRSTDGRGSVDTRLR